MSQSAFPHPSVPESWEPYTSAIGASSGMTMRDYFMAHCPITWDQAQDYNTGGEDEITFFCKLRIEYADAMLAERAK